MPPQFDESRFIEALTRNLPALESFCHATVARREEAREVLQATSVKLWQKAAEWDPESPFLPWAFAVARFVALSHLRDRMRERLVFDEDVVLAMQDETEAAASMYPERRDALEECLQRLKPEHHFLLRAHYIEGLAIKEIAHTAGRGQSAVKMTLLRIREVLSQCIEGKLKPVS